MHKAAYETGHDAHVPEGKRTSFEHTEYGHPQEICAENTHNCGT